MKNNPSLANATSADTELLFRCQAMLGESVESEELLELAMQLLAQELLTKKLQGQSICDNLKLLDRLMRYASLKLRLTNQRLREQKAAAKSATTKARLEKSLRSTTSAPVAPSILPEKRPSEIAAPKMVKFSSCATNAPRKNLTPVESALRQATGNQEGFQIDPKLIALPLMGEAPMVATKTYDLI